MTSNFVEQRACGACNLEGFAVGSKCVVWTSPKWCEAQILEVTDEGTRVSKVSQNALTCTKGFLCMKILIFAGIQQFLDLARFH